MKDRFKFTQKSIAKLPPAEPGKRKIYHDTKYHFMKVRVSDTGTKCLLISSKINGKAIKKVIAQFFGDERDLPMDLIREKARVLFDELKETVGASEELPVPTFDDFVKVWDDSAEMRNLIPSWREAKRRTAEIHCAAIASTPLDQITRGDVRSILTKLMGENHHARLEKSVQFSIRFSSWPLIWAGSPKIWPYPFLGT